MSVSGIKDINYLYMIYQTYIQHALETGDISAIKGREQELESVRSYVNNISKKYPHFFFISDFSHNIDVYVRSIYKSRLGFNHGECLHGDEETPCPGADINPKGAYEIYFEFTKIITNRNLTFEEFEKDNGEMILTYDHSHIGNWHYHWFRKTGYDYGIAGFFFTSEDDCEVAKIIYKLGDEYDMLL